jgi:hypothetical protein
MRLLAPAAVPLLALAAIALLRTPAVPFAAAGAAAGGVFVVALLAGRRQADGARRAAAVTLLVATAGAVAGLVPGLFPCDVECRAGAEWATLFEVPTLAWSAGATLVAALLLFAGEAPPRSTFAALPGELAVRLAAGASLWFLALAWQLRMPCRLCLAVHLPLLSAAALLTSVSIVPATLRAVTLLVGALLTRQAYRLDLERAAPPVAPSVASPTGATQSGEAAPTPPRDPDAAAPPTPDRDAAFDTALLARLDRGRRIGPADAKLRAELVFAYNCGHCAESFAPLLRALDPLCSAGQLEACVRFLHAKKDAQSRTLSHLTFAAALEGRLEARANSIWTARAAALQGDEGGERRGDMQAAVGRWFARDAQTLGALKAAAAALDPAGVALAADFAAIAAAPQSYERFLADEEEALRPLSGDGEMPWLFLVEPATGRIVERLKSGTTPPQLAAAARRRLP